MQNLNALNVNELIRLAVMHNAQTGIYMKMKVKYKPTGPNQIFRVRVMELAKLFIGRSGNPHRKIPYYNMNVLQRGGLIAFSKCGNKGFKFSFPLCSSANEGPLTPTSNHFQDLLSQEFFILRLTDLVRLDELSKITKNNNLKTLCQKIFLEQFKKENEPQLPAGSMKGENEKRNPIR